MLKKLLPLAFSWLCTSYTLLLVANPTVLTPHNVQIAESSLEMSKQWTLSFDDIVDPNMSGVEGYVVKGTLAVQDSESIPVAIKIYATTSKKRNTHAANSWALLRELQDQEIAPKAYLLFLYRGRPCLVMEDGGKDLYSWTLDNDIFNTERTDFWLATIPDITAKIIRTAFFMHRSLIVHLDLKSENILVDGEARRLKVTDFDTVVHRDQVVEELVGTIETVDPVLLARNSKLDVKPFVATQDYDVFSLGCIIFELMSLYVPAHYFLRMNSDIKSSEVLKYQVVEDHILGPDFLQNYTDLQSYIESHQPGALASLIVAMFNPDKKQRPSIETIYRDLFPPLNNETEFRKARKILDDYFREHKERQRPKKPLKHFRKLPKRHNSFADAEATSM